MGDERSTRQIQLPQWRAHVLGRLRRQAAATGDEALATLAEELRGYPGGESGLPLLTDVVVPLLYRHNGAELSASSRKRAETSF